MEWKVTDEMEKDSKELGDQLIVGNRRSGRGLGFSASGDQEGGEAVNKKKIYREIMKRARIDIGA